MASTKADAAAALAAAAALKSAVAATAAAGRTAEVSVTRLLALEAAPSLAATATTATTAAAAVLGLWGEGSAPLAHAVQTRAGRLICFVLARKRKKWISLVFSSSFTIAFPRWKQHSAVSIP
ncbi:hypothetical protein Emed_000350 [Eimeria media]